MRFIGFLNNQTTWQAEYKDTQLNAETVSALLERLADGELNQLDAHKMHVFCVHTPIHALLAYFIGSHFGLTVAIASPRGLPKLLEGIEEHVLGHLLVPQGYRLPHGDWKGAVTQLDLTVKPLTKNTRPLVHSIRSARFVFCTSGTTGKAKRVLHCEQTLIANAKVAADYFGLCPSDHSYCVFPLQFMYGLSTTLCSLWSGSKITFGEFVIPTLVGSYVQQNDISVFPLLGEWSSELSQLWRKNNFQPERLILINASDRLLEQQAEELLPWATKFWNNLGQTESAPRLFALELVQQNSLSNVSYNGTVAVGYSVHPEIEFKLENSIQGVGNLFYKTPFSMIGYLQDDGEIIAPETWIDSGDLFSIDENLLWHWVGRNSHTIKVNGELIPLSMVTSLLLSLDDISGVGYTTSKTGELCAFVESSRHCEQFRHQLLNILADKLRGKRSQVRFIHKLPRTENGKINFTELRQNHVDSVVA